MGTRPTPPTGTPPRRARPALSERPDEGPPESTGSALDLLSGDAQTFVTKVWASRVHLHRTDPDRLVGLLSLDDVDALLTSTAIRTPAVRLAQDGTVLPESRYTRGGTLSGTPLTGLVDARKVLDLFEGGASVVLQGLQRYWPPLTELCARLEDELGHPCQANAYLTPPGSQGFAVHSDSHDVFVFQTHGHKLWEVHEEQDAGADLVRTEVLLEPGLSMYLPTGTPHAARAQESASLHVTLGINQLTWRTVLDDVLRDELDRLDGAAEHLPAGWPDRPGSVAAGLGDRLATLAERLRSVDTEAAEADRLRRFFGQRPPRLAGGLADRLRLAALRDDTELRRRAGSTLRLADEPADAARLAVLLGDRVLHVPAHLRAALDVVATRGRLRPADLPLDEQSRVVLCRRLVREGLLEIVG